jgi:hypothetical protein
MSEPGFFRQLRREIMSYFPSSLNIWGRQWHSNAAPWMANSSQITNAITGENYKGLLSVSGTGPNPSVTSWISEKGGVAAGVTALTWEQGSYAGRNLGCIQFGTVGGAGSGVATFDPIGSLISGTAKSWTIFLSAQLRATPIGGGSHYLLTFGRSTAAPPFIGFSIPTGTTQLTLQRRNDANVVVNSPTSPTLGTNPFVVAATYNGVSVGSELTWRLNGVPQDTGVNFGGGAQTLNRFTLGALRLNGAASGFSNMTFDRFAITPGVAMSGNVFNSVERYLLRRVGL